MCRTEEQLILLDIDHKLKAFDYDKVNLMNLDPLRIEVKRRLNQLSRKH